MFRLPRFLLYCFAIFIGVAGLLEGGLPLLQYTIKRLQGEYFDAYEVLSSYDRFSSEVILILSLMLLILVHIGHVLAGGLRLTKSGKSISSDVPSGGPPQKSPKESIPSPSVSEPVPASASVESANEKLAHLTKPPTDKSGP